MKNLLVILLLFFSFGSLAQLKTDWERYNLNGKVRTVKTSSNIDTATIKDSAFVKYTVDSFNRNGTLAKSVHVLHENIYSFVNCLYNEKKLLIEKDFYEGNRIDHKYIFTYNNAGRMSESFLVNIEGIKKPLVVCKYKNEKLSEEIEYHPDAVTLISYQINRYKTDERCFERVYYTDSSTIDRIERYTYNRNDQIAECFEIYADGTIMNTIKIFYDNKNNITELKLLTPKGKETIEQINKLTYDKYRNWVEQIQYFEGNYQARIVREITYY